MAGEIRTDDLIPDTLVALRKRSWLHRTTTTILFALLALGLVDALGWWPVYGVSSTEVHATGGGYDLTVTYADVSRPALATPFEITVSRPDGFSAPVTVAIDQRYLAMWDENGVMPEPTGEAVNGPWVEWEFDPPPGTTFTIVYDGRIEPAQQTGRDGAVAIVEDGRIVAEVEFSTRVMP